MPEKDKEKKSERVKPLEVKPGGKEKGTKIVHLAAKGNTEDKK